MLHSMTGFGKAICNLGNLKLSIEVKSLNSKQVDLNCKVPFDLREKEFLIRNLLSSKLKRGKVDCMFVMEQDSSQGSSEINRSLFKYYFDQIKDLAIDNNIESSDRLMLTALKMPDVISNSRIELNDETWSEIQLKLEEAIEQCIAFRKQEGKTVHTELNERVENISKLLIQVKNFEDERIVTVRDRIRENIKEFVENKNIDENRFEQEMIYFLEKLDISEEKSRLENHCKYFIETANNEEMVGKKLNFISQEMGREINTLGSKANNASIQRLVVQMKDELEKIKEQVLNVL